CSIHRRADLILDAKLQRLALITGDEKRPREQLAELHDDRLRIGSAGHRRAAASRSPSEAPDRPDTRPERLLVSGAEFRPPRHSKLLRLLAEGGTDRFDGFDLSRVPRHPRPLPHIIGAFARSGKALAALCCGPRRRPFHTIACRSGTRRAARMPTATVISPLSRSVSTVPKWMKPRP